MGYLGSEPNHLLAARKPSSHRSLITFAACQCLVHASIMAVQTAEAWKHGARRQVGDVVLLGIIGAVFARTLTTKTRTARNRHAMIGEISPPHSLTFNKAKQKRTLVKTPVHGSYSQPRPAKGSLGYRAVRPVGSANNRGWLLSQPLRQLASNGRMDTNFVLPRRTSDQVAIIVTEVGTGVGSSNAHPCVRAGEDTVFRLACLTR